MTPRLVAESARLAGQPLLRCQTDRRLVDLVRAGNDRAFEAIVDRYRPSILRYCTRLLPPARAEDAVQQTFLNAFAAMRRGDAELDLRPWLYRIARNACLNALRENGWTHEQIENLRQGTESAHDAVERRAELRELVAAVHTLPERQRDAMVLRELEGRSYDEIAAALDASDGAVRQLLNRARNALRAGVSAITPSALLVRLSTPRAHRVVAQVSEAAGQEGLRATAARIAGLVGASLLLFGGMSQAPRVPAGVGELSPRDSALTMLSPAPASTRDQASAPNGSPTGSGGTPFAAPRAAVGSAPGDTDWIEAESGAAPRIRASRLPACRCTPAPASSVSGVSGGSSYDTGFDRWAASIIGAAVHVLEGHVAAPITEVVGRVVGPAVPDRRAAEGGSAGAPAVRGHTVGTPAARETVTQTVTATVTASPVSQPPRDNVPARADGDWDGAAPEASPDDAGEPNADAEPTDSQPAPETAKPEPTDPDSVIAVATETIEIVKEEDGADDENEEGDPGDERGDDRDDDDDSDNVLPNDLGPGDNR